VGCKYAKIPSYSVPLPQLDLNGPFFLWQRMGRNGSELRRRKRWIGEERDRWERDWDTALFLKILDLICCGF